MQVSLGLVSGKRDPYVITSHLDKGEVISRTTVQHIPRDKFLKVKVQQNVKDYHSSLDMVLGQDQYIYAQEDTMSLTTHFCFF